MLELTVHLERDLYILWDLWVKEYDVTVGGLGCEKPNAWRSSKYRR